MSDALYRLTDVAVEVPEVNDEAFTYDAVGNRKTEAGIEGEWNYNENNELLTFADVEYTYDDNGNMSHVKLDGTVVLTYTYDAADRMVQVDDVNGATIAEYYYDPFGRRLWKDIGGTRTYFFYADEGLVAEYDASGVEIRTYGYKPNSTWTTDPLFLNQGTDYYFYQNDHLGTSQKLVGVNGAVVWSATYSAFGKADVQVETVTNNLRFPGQYADTETGLHYNWFRYYEPGNGRYLRTDPIGFLGGDVNLYAYVLNNPGMFGDPDGLTLTGAGIGAAIGAVIGGTVGGVVGVVGGSAVGTFVVPGVGTIGGGVVGGSEGVASGAAAGAVVGGVIGGWIGHRISDRCDPDALPQDKTKPIPIPRIDEDPSHKGWWLCKARCNVHPTPYKKGGKKYPAPPDSECPPHTEGSAVRKTKPEAMRAAKINAQQAIRGYLGCRTRHCHVISCKRI